MTQNPDCIILFTKFPKPGRVKTRLIPTLGPEGAASLHKEMTKYVYGCLKEAARTLGSELEVWFDGADENEMKQFLGEGMIYKHQGSGDLGERMQRAFKITFARNKERALIVGSDCPTVRTDIIAQTFELLRANDIVLGPAQDGGYYLIGMRDECRDIFSKIPWSTNRVLEMTKTKIRETGLSLGLLPEMVDVDTEHDLHIFEEAKRTPARPKRNNKS